VPEIHWVLSRGAWQKQGLVSDSYPAGYYWVKDAPKKIVSIKKLDNQETID